MKKMAFGEKMLCIIIILNQIIRFQVYGCWEEEKAALFLIKENAKPNLYGDLKSWSNNNTSDCCDWKGITCGKSKRIISLSLYSMFNSEQGWHVNATIFYPFQELRELDLSFNNIQSWKEDKGTKKLSSRLTNLVSLDISENHVNNSILSELSGLRSLKHLNLANNELTGSINLHDIQAINQNLEKLILRFNSITSIMMDEGCGQHHKLQRIQLNGNTSCLTALLQSLKELDLSNNDFNGVIPLWLQNLTSLKTLDLSRNQFTGYVGSSPLIHLLSLEFLDLSQNQIQIPDTFQSFANHTKLKYIVEDSNQVVHEISNKDVQPFTRRLHFLSLSNCRLNVYPHFLHRQHDLRLIDLSDNIIGGNFPTWILENNQRLHTLFLSNASLFGSLHFLNLSHPYMRILHIANNKFQGPIPPNIGMVFPKLIDLDLSNNRFEGKIPPSLSSLKSLEGLYLSNNFLLGGIEQLPKSSINLTFLDLSNNDFEGELQSFHEFPKLENLFLQGNKFSGRLTDDTFGRNPSLMALLLNNNSLVGSIPNSICNGSKFDYFIVLDLSFNNLNGPLPNCTSSFLEILNLNNNRLSGHVTEAFFKNASGLQQLDLSNNNLIGTIPAAIGNLTILNSLLLKGNQFQGHVPVELCKLLQLDMLDLSSNRLSGPIPTCLGEIGFSSISVLNGVGSVGDLKGDDKLSSLIFDKRQPSYDDFANRVNKVQFTTKRNTYSFKGYMLFYISGIDLSCNLLTGQIPHELGNLTSLHALNLSHNRFWGAIPPLLSNLQSIESLDLSFNNLNGSISDALTTLNTLEVFNVSYNNLSGRIPFEAQFSTFDSSSYQGNPLLCGPPLSNNCTTSESPSVISGSSSKDHENEDDTRIDVETFYMTFMISGVTMFVTVVIMLFINPYWLNASFYLVKVCFSTTHYFIEDSRRRFREARQVNVDP